MGHVSYASLQPTRDFVQDIARVMGKAQQVFLRADPNDWHRGLLITTNGLAAQPFSHTITDNLKIELNLHNGTVSIGAKTWEIATISAQNLLQEMLHTANEVLQGIKPSITNGVVGPVLLYPHHFDASLSWFPDRHVASDTSQERQYTFGFSTGGGSIEEPYYYATLWPNTAEFTAKTLPPAYWQHTGFTGAVLKYNDTLDQPLNLPQTFFKALLA